jgi:CRISPR-associated protein Cas8a1/Csx13
MDSLTIDLFEPGMSALHRAGLGGLACTLNWIETTEQPIQRPPGAGIFDNRRITLRWGGGPEGARAFFEQLYRLAFDIRDGLIHLPGCYWPRDIKPEVKAELQQGMSLTILQFGPNRKARSKTPEVKTYDVDGQSMTIQHQYLTDYTHRSAWETLVTSKGTLRPNVAISGTIAPGFVQRHVVHSSSTIEQPPGLAVALHFALVGTLSLAIGRKTGVMVVPDVQDLKEFARRRYQLNPGTTKGCQVSSPADAALQAQLRLRAAGAGQTLRLDRCLAVLFETEAWNPNQKTRSSVLDVDPDSRDLDLFEEAMKIQELQPRLAFAKPERKGEPPRPFWSRGVVRPLVAENLARHDPWYRNFRSLIVSSDGSTDEDRVRLLGFETKGLQTMIKKTPWHDQGERVFVESVHEAMRSRFAAIGEETDDPVTFSNRVDRQRQRWRLKFAGAKTPDDLRAALADLWSRSDYNPTLREGWRTVLPLICDEDRWQLTRDLVLLGLASYKKPEKSGEAGETEAVAPGQGANP